MITVFHSDCIGLLFGCAVILLAFGALLGITGMRLALGYEMRRAEKRKSEILLQNDQAPLRAQKEGE